MHLCEIVAIKIVSAVFTTWLGGRQMRSEHFREEKNLLAWAGSRTSYRPSRR